MGKEVSAVVVRNYGRQKRALKWDAETHGGPFSRGRRRGNEKQWPAWLGLWRPGRS